MIECPRKKGYKANDVSGEVPESDDLQKVIRNFDGKQVVVCLHQPKMLLGAIMNK